MGNNGYGARSAEDLDRDTLTYAEVKAIASGNPLILEKFKVENELKQLYLSKQRYDKSRADLGQRIRTYLPTQLKESRDFLNCLEIDVRDIVDLSGDNFTMQLNGREFNTRTSASEMLYKLFSTLTTEKKVIGNISGFDVVGYKDEIWLKPRIYLKNNGEYSVDISYEQEIGNILKMENILKGLSKRIDEEKDSIKYFEKELEDAKTEYDKPFAQMERIRELQKLQAKIDSELDLDKQDTSVISKEEEQLEK